MSRPIALIGVTGSVGAATAVLLAARGHRLRLGVRDPDRRFDPALGSVHRCDLTDTPSADWLADCGVLVNCAGPSGVTTGPAAELARRAGVPLVDPAGGEAVARHLASTASVLGAGLSPGLDVVVVAGLLRGLDRGATSVCISGGVDELGLSGAADFLSGLDGDAGQPATVWRDGRPAPDPAEDRSAAEVPYFPRRVELRAFLSGEARRLADRVGLADAVWLSAFERGAFLDALTGRVTDPPLLAAAARLDSAGRRRYYHLLAAVSGTRDGVEQRRALLLRSPRAAALAAVVAVAAAEYALTGAAADGPRAASDVLSCDDVLALAPAAGIRVEVVDAGAALAVAAGEPAPVEEGVL